MVTHQSAGIGTSDTRLRVSFELDGVAMDALTCGLDPAGALLATDAALVSGTTLRMLAVTLEDGAAPIRVDVEVLAASRAGIVPVRWITASSSPDPKPLREFLQKTLVISGGFVEVVDLGAGRREFVYHFPQVAEPPPLPPMDPPAPPPPVAIRAVRPPHLSRSPKGPEMTSTGVARRIKIRLPALYTYDGVDCAGEVVRLSDESISVVSDGRNVPEMRAHVDVVIGIRDRRDRTHDVTLSGPVVRILASAPPTRFDVSVSEVREAKEGVFKAYLQYLFRQAGVLPTP